MVLVLRQNREFQFLLTSTSGKTVVMAMALRVSFCFSFDAHLWWQEEKVARRKGLFFRKKHSTTRKKES